MPRTPPSHKKPSSSVVPLTIAVAGLLVLIVGAAAAAAGYASRFDKIPVHTSKLSGQEWMEELLNGHDERFYNEMGMHKHVFQQLLKVLAKLGGLKDSKYISAVE